MPSENKPRGKGQFIMQLEDINSLFDGVATKDEIAQIVKSLTQEVKAITDELRGNGDQSRGELESELNNLRNDLELFIEQIKIFAEDNDLTQSELSQARAKLEANYASLAEQYAEMREEMDEMDTESIVRSIVGETENKLRTELAHKTPAQIRDELLSLPQGDRFPAQMISNWDDIEKEWSRVISLAATAQIEVLSDGTKVGSSHRMNFSAGATVTMEAGTINVAVDGLPSQTGNDGKFLKTDGAVASWETIAGGGDMLASNNLSDLVNKATSRTNLGLKGAAILDVGTTAGTVAAGDHNHTGVYQPADAELTAIAGLTSAANKVPVFSGSGTATLLDFKDEDNMASDSATAVPSQQSTKAYVDTAVALLQPKAAIVDGNAFTGFKDPDGITVAYSYTDRTITLTGDLTYYWKGAAKSLSSPWTSSAHTNSTGNWYLYTTDGTTFAWSNSIWDFTQVMVAYVKRGASAAASFAVRETHGMMDPESHEELHAVIGTYRFSGGGVKAGTYAENTASDAGVTMGFDAAVIKDEDLATTIPEWVDGTYTTMYIGASSAATFNVASSYPFIAAGADNFIQVNDVTTGSMTAGSNNRYYNVYQLLVPACSDTDSQKYRMIMVQPQATYTSLAAAQGESVNSISLGDFSSNEYVIYARITYVTATGDSNYGKCRIATGGISYVLGNKTSQTTIAGVSPSAHTSLSNLTWSASGHLGTATSVAGFDSAGVATNYGVDADLSTTSANDDTLPSAKATKAYADSKVADAINDGTTTVAPSQNAVFDALALKLALAGGTMTGNLTLGENTSIALDPAGSADGKYTGITITGTAGAALAFGDLIYLDPTDSRWELADANSAASADGDARGILGICVLAAAGDGSATTILLEGIVRADTAFPALTIGAPVYVGETAGDIVVTQPTTADVVIRIVGVAITADEIFFRPDFTWITHT